MSVEQHREQAPKRLGFGILTVSDTRTPQDDVSGPRIRELVTAAGHRVVETLLQPDHTVEIRWAVQGLLADPEIDVVVVTGGTGLSPRDVTLDAVVPLFERPVEGFGELFRMLSWQEVGAAAMLSRASAGVVSGCPVFLLPGSPKAVELAMSRLILPEAAHLVGLLRKRA